MDLASVVAALASVGVRVSGSTPNSNVQVDSSRACPTGLAGPEPSGTINDPGQHFHRSACVLRVPLIQLKYTPKLWKSTFSYCPYFSSPFLLRTVLGALVVRHGVAAGTQGLSASCYQNVFMRVFQLLLCVSCCLLLV